MKPKMTVVKSPRLDDEAKKDKKGAPLTLTETLALLDPNSRANIQARENIVIENLRRKGLIK